MRLFSSFLLWLMMLAIPVQGFAAASMLYCGMGAAHQHVQTEAALGSPNMARPASHMNHSADVTDGKVAGLTEPGDKAHGLSGKLPDSAHKCGVCAACCNLIGLAQTPSLLAPTISPPAQYLEPLAQFYAASLRLLERPPRS